MIRIWNLSVFHVYLNEICNFSRIQNILIKFYGLPVEFRIYCETLLTSGWIQNKFNWLPVEFKIFL